MIYSIDDINYNVEYDSESTKNKIPIVFFHGFTGSIRDWYFIKKKLLPDFAYYFIDLLGHGDTDSPTKVENYTFENQLEQINKLFTMLGIKNSILVGYSMGGRLALSYAMKFSNNVRALVLESTSFGLEETAKRENRILTDKKLVNKINNSTIEEFIYYWMDIPLFVSQKRMSQENLKQVYKNKIETNNKVGLGNSLLGFGSGKMENYYPQFQNFNKQILLLAGELDIKYSKIAKKVNITLPHSELKIMNNSGHNVHLEKTEEFLKLLNEFLLNIRDDK